MFKWKKRAGFCALALLNLIGNSLEAAKKTDFQIWNKNYVRGHLNKRVDVSLDVQFRYKDSGSKLYYNHEHFELPIHVTSFFIIGPAYRQVFNLKDHTRNQWSTSYLPNINFTFLWHLGPYQFYNRGRFTYVIEPGNPPDVLQYRNLLGVHRTLSDKLHGVRLFADDEIFLEQKQKGIYENRATIGFNVGLFKKIRMDLAYRNRIVRISGGWEHDNILVINPYVDF